MNDEPMQVVSLVGGPADGIVALLPSSQGALSIQQPSSPDQGTITGTYVSSSAFGPQGYPAWDWRPEVADPALA